MFLWEASGFSTCWNEVSKQNPSDFWRETRRNLLAFMISWKKSFLCSYACGQEMESKNCVVKAVEAQERFGIF